MRKKLDFKTYEEMWHSNKPNKYLKSLLESYIGEDKDKQDKFLEIFNKN